jgi:hypothetical protein
VSVGPAAAGPSFRLRTANGAGKFSFRQNAGYPSALCRTSDVVKAHLKRKCPAGAGPSLPSFGQERVEGSTRHALCQPSAVPAELKSSISSTAAFCVAELRLDLLLNRDTRRDPSLLLETRLVVRGSDLCGVILPQGNGQARGNEVPGAMLP